jgi:hypothetical protein
MSKGLVKKTLVDLHQKICFKFILFNVQSISFKNINVENTTIISLKCLNLFLETLIKVKYIVCMKI